MPEFDLAILPAWSDELAEELALPHRGGRRRILRAATPSDADETALIFLGGTTPAERCSGTAIASSDLAERLVERGLAVIVSPTPRLDFARALDRLRPPVPSGIDPGASVADDASVHPEARIEFGASIESGAVIGPAVRVRAHAVVRSGVRVQDGCDVGEHCVLGNDGLTVPVDDDGVPRPMRHLGGLEVGEGVRIGPLTTIGRGTLGVAEIGARCVIGPQVNIGHNARIGPDCIVTGGARLAGGVRLGTGCWIGTGAVIHHKVGVGDRATVGGGAVVTSDVAMGETRAAIPSMSTRDVARLLRVVRRS